MNPAPCLTASSALVGPSRAWVASPCCSLLASHLQDGRFHLRVFMEAVLPDGRVDVAQDTTLVCPKPDHSWTPDSQLAPPTMSSVSTPQTLPSLPTSGHTSPGSGHAFPSPLDPGHSSVHPTPALPSPGPGPALATLAQPHWGPLEHWDVNKPDYIGTQDI